MKTVTNTFTHSSFACFRLLFLSLPTEMGSWKMGNEYASVLACRCAFHAQMLMHIRFSIHENVFFFCLMEISTIIVIFFTSNSFAWHFSHFFIGFSHKLLLLKMRLIFFYPIFTVSPESIVIPIVSCIFGFPLLALLVICCLRHRAKMARERDRRRNYDLQDHAVSLVRFSPIHRLSESSKIHTQNNWFLKIIPIQLFIGFYRCFYLFGSFAWFDFFCVITPLAFCLLFSSILYTLQYL